MEQKLEYQKNIRSHWGVENKLHWTLDVGFSEDASRKRNKNAAQNYSVLLKIALNLLKNEKTVKQGIAGKRLKAGWNDNYWANSYFNIKTFNMYILTKHFDIILIRITFALL